MTARPLPLTVVGGFLGAGKTTLVNHWLQDLPAGRRIAVLVNDFGAINIDASLVAARGADTVALTNGCVCCSIGGDLNAALMRLLEQGADFDAVVIEASGVSDPWRIAQLGLADPDLALEAVVVLVDAAAVLAQAADPLLGDTLRRQVAAADLLVLNKVDLADAQQRSAVRAWLASAAPRTPVLETTQALLPLPAWEAEMQCSGHRHRAAAEGFDRQAAGIAAPRSRNDPGPGRADSHGNGRGLGARQGEDAGPCHGSAHHDAQAHGDAVGHADLFESRSLQPAGVFSTDALRAALRDLPAGVLRCKGIVRTDRHGWTEVQFAGRHAALRPAEEPRAGAALVAIGLRGQLPPDTLERLVAAAAAARDARLG